MFIARQFSEELQKIIISMIANTREELEQLIVGYTNPIIEETDIEYELYNGEYLTKEEIIQKEQERINNLTQTRSDVWRALIQARMFTKAQVKAMIEEMPEETDEQKMAKEIARIDVDDVEDFHRGHELVNLVGEYLEITSENLDLYFETGDYHYLLPAYTFSIVATPENAKIIINGEEQSEIELQYKPEGNLVEYEVSAEGYITVTGSKTVTQEETLEIVLEEEQEPEPEVVDEEETSQDEPEPEE